MEAYLPSSTFFFSLPHHTQKKKKKLKFCNQIPNIEAFVGTQNATSFWHINISQKRTTLGKAYGIKVGCYLQKPLGTQQKKINNNNNNKFKSTLFTKEKNQCCACKCTYILSTLNDFTIYIN